MSSLAARALRGFREPWVRRDGRTERRCSATAELSLGEGKHTGVNEVGAGLKSRGESGLTWVYRFGRERPGPADRARLRRAAAERRQAEATDRHGNRCHPQTSPRAELPAELQEDGSQLRFIHIQTVKESTETHRRYFKSSLMRKRGNIVIRTFVGAGGRLSGGVASVRLCRSEI